ncbi:hypothetical protein OUZ56_015571 [Daphnia magna]|uniref:Uncharacterized protein n=1 Tax=Daphnia magna TaxID=35525 RepID=A0ABR0ANB4_9CRUS|nr:hypothetical protein OUZ56_015571 [Daphnia magna]
MSMYSIEVSGWKLIQCELFGKDLALFVIDSFIGRTRVARRLWICISTIDLNGCTLKRETCNRSLLMELLHTGTLYSSWISGLLYVTMRESIELTHHMSYVRGSLFQPKTGDVARGSP